MTNEVALFLKLTLRASLREPFANWYERNLPSGEIPVEVVEAVRDAPSDNGRIVSLLNRYLSQAPSVNEDAVFDMVWQELHNRFRAGTDMAHMIDLSRRILMAYSENHTDYPPAWNDLNRLVSYYGTTHSAFLPHNYTSAFSAYFENKTPLGIGFPWN